MRLRWRLRSIQALLVGVLVSAGCTPAQVVSRPDEPAFEVSLAATDHLAMAWHGGPLARSAIWLRFIERGRPAGSPLQLTDARRDAYEPDLQFHGRKLAIAWYEKDAASGASSAWLAGLDEQGREVWRRQLNGAGSARNPLVRVMGSDLTAVWIETAAGRSDLWSARFDAAGAPRGPATRIAPASTNTWNLNAAVDESGVLYVVYDAALDTRAQELQLLRIADQQIEHWSLSADDGFDSTYPDIALQGDHVAVTWIDARDGNQEVYLFAGSLAQLRVSPDASPAAFVAAGARRITRTPGSSFGAYLAWNQGRLGLAWSDDVAGATELRVQHFDVNGTPLGAARSLTHGPGRSMIPSIRSWQHGFAVAWNTYRPTGGQPGQVERDGDSLPAPPRDSVADLRLLR